MNGNPAEMEDSDALEVRALLRQSLETALARHYSFEQRSAAYRSPARHSAEAWTAYAELGLLALSLPEAHGGLPGALADVAMVSELLGGVLALEPYRATMVAARLLAAAGTAEQQARWLPDLAAGMLKAALVPVDPNAPAFAKASRTDAGWRISGRFLVVPGGDAADLFIVPARADGEIALFLLPANAAERRGYGCFDWTGAADLVAADVPVSADARLASGAEALARAMDEAVILASADAVGAMRAANALTRDYTRTRRQFGVPLASFQVLQHRMADMAIAEEAAASITKAALVAYAQGEAATRARAASAAKVAVGDAAREVARQCVQLHGGMGLAEEYPAAHYFARLGLFERLLGDRDAHVQRVAALRDKLASPAL